MKLYIFTKQVDSMDFVTLANGVKMLRGFRLYD